MKYLPILFLFLFFGCGQKTPTGLQHPLDGMEFINGPTEYLRSPFVAAGDRVYIVGHQDGSFPDLGWHVTGEMGGIWDHPIKLMDGFSLHLADNSDLNWCLTDATLFRNYPMANLHFFEKPEEMLSVRRLQYVPDGVEGAVVEFTIKNEGEHERQFTLSFTAMVDLMPVWLAERKEIEDGADWGYHNEKLQAIIAKDSLNDWFAVFGSAGKSEVGDLNPCETPRRGKGKDFMLKQEITVPAGESVSVPFFISGSYHSEEAALETFNKLRQNHKQFLADKINRYEEIASCNQLVLADSGLTQMYQWVKYSTDWLVRDVPEQGRGLSAGIPDYPWWFGTDNGYAIQGMLAAGMHEEALATIDLIIKLSKEANGENGKIMHEASTNGVIFNPGNLNTTPNFIYAMWQAFIWTGDSALLDHYEYVKAGISWLEEQDKDKNGYPDGAGMMEIHGLHTEMIDVIAYQCKAYQAAANFAKEVGDAASAISYRLKFEQLRERINKEWWVQDFESFADFRASNGQALDLIDAAIVRADTIDKPWSVEELKETRKAVKGVNETGQTGYVVHHNWVVNTPMELGLADPEKAKRALQMARNYRNRFGMFVTGIDRDENQEKSEKWKSFSYVAAVMTLPTGVQAIGEARYGNPDESLKYLKMLQNSFSYALPGSMYEVSPDFGMIAQAWNIYAVVVPIVNHYFGIEPRAFEKQVTIKPSFPSAWETGTLKRIRVGDNELDIDFEITEREIRYLIEQKNEDWNIFFQVKEVNKVLLNGNSLELSNGTALVEMTGNINELRIIREAY